MTELTIHYAIAQDSQTYQCGWCHKQFTTHKLGGTTQCPHCNTWGSKRGYPGATAYPTTWGKDALSLEEWPLLVRELIRQGIVQDEAEAVRRLEAGEKLTVNLPIKSDTEWRGIYGTTE